MNKNETGNCRHKLKNIHSKFIAYKPFAAVIIKYM